MDEEFQERLKKVQDFESDLKAVFEKHKVKLKNDVEPYHGGCDDVIKILVNGDHWISWNFDETLRNIEVID